MILILLPTLGGVVRLDLCDLTFLLYRLLHFVKFSFERDSGHGE